jgi:nitrite reductase/ring-hydroxylating ferredoxin subunit
MDSRLLKSGTADPFPVAADAERRLDRRRFLGVAGAAAVLTLAGEWLGRAAAAARPRLGQVRLDAAQPLAVGEARAVAGPSGGEALVVRLDAATVVGFDRRGPHLGCPVLWSAARGRFECPCHHAAFDARTGRVLFGPPQRGLETVTVLAGAAPGAAGGVRVACAPHPDLPPQAGKEPSDKRRNGQ